MSVVTAGGRIHVMFGERGCYRFPMGSTAMPTLQACGVIQWHHRFWVCVTSLVMKANKAG